ncbi:MAG: hypothetical protein A3E51_14240 [Burkholderiales bacterium RIFCSPHIGHO2_12_FULL_67_38]|nr:MAG: hypothetical protein A3E51_14240 [Burkholderiales bacterium RIFCSPHIGHO2_12_FULL_67_38]
MRELCRIPDRAVTEQHLVDAIRLEANLIIRAQQAQHETTGDVLTRQRVRTSLAPEQGHLIRTDAGCDDYAVVVLVVGKVDDRVGAATGLEHIGVGAVATVEPVVAGATVEHIVTVIAQQGLIAGAALQVVGSPGATQEILSGHSLHERLGHLRELGFVPGGPVCKGDGPNLTRCQELSSIRSQNPEYKAAAQIHAR